MNPLSELKDIHLPQPAPWWELAWGWWLLAVLMLGLLVWGIPKLKSWFDQRAKKKVLRVSVHEHLMVIRQHYQSHQDKTKAVADISTYLRRVSLTLFEEKHIAGLVGEPWFKFLDAQWIKNTPEQSFMRQEIQVLLSTGVYQPAFDIDENALESLFTMTDVWVKDVVKQHV